MNAHPGRAITQSWIMGATREQLLAWLEWNDPNGCYSDADCAAEGGFVLSLHEAQTMVYHQAFGA